MVIRTLHALAVLIVTGALLIIAPGTATAINGCPNPFWGFFCPDEYLMTPGYGPLARTTQISAAGADARFGLYSPETDAFTPSTEWMPMVKNGPINVSAAKATDNVVAPVEGYATVSTPLGEATWATQFFFDHGRWGIYNLITKLFYPQGDWYPRSCGSNEAAATRGSQALTVAPAGHRC
jgi:hypothetical protein